MSTESDPPRLRDEESASTARVRALLTTVREDVGTEEQSHHVESRLAPMLWAPAPVAAPGGGAMLAAVKLGALVVVAAAAGGSFWMGTKSDAPLTASPTQRPPVFIRPAAPAALPAPPAAASADTVPKPQPATPHPQSSTEAPVSEADLLTRAQAALGRDAAKALVLAEQHQRTFPHGTLSQEREVIAIEALSRLGRTAEVKLRAARFLQAYPGSAHKSKIQSLLGSQ
jgi:hypothetical protein